MISRDKILQKVQRIEEERDYIQRCVNAKICPTCGEPLTITDLNDGCDMGDMELQASCSQGHKWSA